MAEIQENNVVKTPVYKKWWFWVIIVVVVLAIIGGAVGAAAGGSNDSADNKDNDKNNTTNNFYIGDTVSSNSIDFTVTEVTNTKLLGTELFGYNTESNFIVVTVSVKNNNNDEKDILNSYVSLYKGSAKYEPHAGSVVLDNGFYITKSVGAQLTTTIVFAFETPTESTQDEYTLSVKGGSLATTQKIILKNKT